MTVKQTAGRDQLGDFAPQFAELNDDVLFGQVWSRDEALSLRDRSLITVVALMAQGLCDSSFRYHLLTAKQNGITRSQIADILTHAAFYAGWPKAWAAFRLAKEVWTEEDSSLLSDAKTTHEQSMLFPIANSIVQAGVNTMGTDQIAAWGICDKMNMLIWLISDSMGPALTTFVAQNLGARNPERIRKGVRAGTAMSAGAVILISVGLFFFAQMLTPLFVSSQDAASLSELVGTYSRMMAPFFCFYALAEAFSGACCGTGDTIRPMITTLLAICLLRVLGILLVLPGYGTMECIVMIYIASWIAAGVSFLLLWHRDAAHISR